MTMWTVDANGVKGNAAFANKIMSNATNGTIVLIHFTEFTPDGVPDADRPAAQREEARTDQHHRPVHLSRLTDARSSAVITAFACWRSCSTVASCCGSSAVRWSTAAL